MDEATCLNMGLLKRVRGEVRVKLHALGSIVDPIHTSEPHTNKARTFQTIPSVPLDQPGCYSTVSDIAMLMEQMSDLHFKLDAYFAHMGFTRHLDNDVDTEGSLLSFLSFSIIFYCIIGYSLCPENNEPVKFTPIF